ncbi:hypothetical protein [Nocardia farcinica]|uniref:hypothetical protein n=1 Tax=Nocardia farcinica TaxID=37329 RepID=UPI002455F07A|nr:hypothetical protein [Nocardia farcinica]
MTTHTEGRPQEPDLHCRTAPTILGLDHARTLLDAHTGHHVCAAFRAALEYSTAVYR